MGKRISLIAAAVALTAAAIAVAVWVARPDTGSPYPIDSYRLTADDRRIVVTVVLAPRDTVVGTDVQESPEAVLVTVRVVSTGTSTDLGVRHDIEVVLAAPLGDRIVLDHNRRPVPQNASTRTS